MEPLTALFPPGKGGGEGVAYGGKGKGVLMHVLTDGNVMPLSSCITVANGDERQQILPLIDQVKVKTARGSCPKQRFKVLAADKGYDAKWLRQKLRQRGIRGQIPKRRWRGKPR